MMNVSRADVLTIPNAMSASGFGLVMDGLRRGIDTPAGAAEVFVGRVADVADGYVARKTGQTSEFGALLDASLDKLGLSAILFSEVRKGMVPPVVTAGIVFQNLTNVAATEMARTAHPDAELITSREGKRAMFAQNLALGCYSISRILEANAKPGFKTARNIGHIMAAAGVLYYGPKATKQYIDRI